MKHVKALFGDNRDAYNILKQPDGMKTSSTTLHANDTALVLTEEDGLQIFLPASGELSDRALALVQIYYEMVTDHPKRIPTGFTKIFTDKIKALI